MDADRAEAAGGGASGDLRTRRRQELRTHVAQVAVGLFGQHGYESVTMDDIASAAGISKRTLFRHFEAKDEIVMGGTRQSAGPMSRLQVSGLDAIDTLGAIEEIYSVMLDQMVTSQTALQAQVVIARNAKLADTARGLHRDLMEELRSSLADEVGSGLLARLVVELSTATLHAALTEWGASTDPGENGQRLIDLYQEARVRARTLLR